MYCSKRGNLRSREQARWLRWRETDVTSTLFNQHQPAHNPRAVPPRTPMMWSKITSALKPLTSSKEEPSASHTHSEVLNKVYEQHPNLSMFHANESGIVSRHSVDGPSPSVHSKKSMFKRLSKPAPKEDVDIARSQSPFQQPPTNSKKSKTPSDLLASLNGTVAIFTSSILRNFIFS